MGKSKAATAKAPAPVLPEPPKSAPERFAAFLADRDLTNVKAGELFDCAPSYITMLRRGQVTPGLDLAARIEKHTGIECRAWVA